MSEEERQRRGRQVAIDQQQHLVERAAEQAFKELADVLSETREHRYDVSQSTQASDSRVEQLFVLEAEHRKVVFARTTHFRGTLGRGDAPLLRWPDEDTLRRRRLPSPPQNLYPPFWLLYDDMGGFRSPSKLVWGAVASSMVKFDLQAATYTFQLHGSSKDIPVTLEGFDAVRDYWLRSGAAAVGVDLG